MPLTSPVARRIPYDANGATVLYQFPDAGDPSTKDMEADHPGSVVDLNDEDNNDLSQIAWTEERNRIIILLAEDWDLSAYLVAVDSPGGVGTPIIEVSSDTTNGLDGTWTAHGSPVLKSDVFQDYRDPTLWSQAGINAFRVTVPNMNVEDFRAIHLWGQVSSGQTLDRIEFINDGTGNPYTASEDSGDVPVGQSQDRDVRVRNLSATLTANNVVVSAESLYQPGDDPAAWYTFSLNGATGPFQTTQTIASIGPGSEQVVTVRQVIPSDDTITRQAPRFKAIPGSWT